MANSKLEKTIDDFYESLADKDEATLKRVAVAHQRTIDKLGLQLESVISKIEQDSLLGLDSGTYFLQRDRLASFVSEANTFFNEFGGDVGVSLTQAQKDVVKLADSFIPEVIEGINGPTPLGYTFAKLPEGAIQQFVGTLGNGSPVRTLTDSFGAEASKTLNNLLLTGISTGQNPLTIAKQMQSAVPTIGIKRANTIARTEMMRAYRGSAQKVMKANKGLVKGWKWYSALDRRTCPVCWSMHGRTFPVDELMATHPNCRCVQLPMTKSWQELGYNAPEPPLSKGMSLSGEELFAELDEATQQFILGKAGFTGYKNGIFKLSDFVQDTYSPEWGFGRTTRSISSMVGKTNTNTLVAGKVPRGIAVRPSKLDLPANFDPLAQSKKLVDDAYQTGKLSETDYNLINDLIESGGYTKAEEIEDAVTALYDMRVKEIDDLLVEVVNLDALTQTQIDGIVTALENGANVDELNAIKQVMQQGIQNKKDIIKKEYDDAIAELLMEKQKAEMFGSTNQTLLDAIQDSVDNGFYATKQDVLDAMQLVSKEVKLNDPYLKLIDEFDKATKLNPGLTSQATGIDVYSLSLQEVKDQIQIWEGLVHDYTNLSSATVTYHPKFNDLQKLLNDGKITQQEFKTLIKEAANGQYTNKSFTEAVETLENAASKKITKSSQELLSELQNTGYSQAEKNYIEQQYKSKAINKEDMQQYLDNAPPKPATPSNVVNAPSPITNWATPQDALNDAYDAYVNGTISYKDYKAIKKVYLNIGDYNPWGKFVDEDTFKKYVEKKLGIKPNPSGSTLKGLPYKKHMVDLDNFLKSGVIDQNTYDDILLKYAQGKYKNKQVEQILNNIKVSLGQKGTSSYATGNVKSFQWDYQGWIHGRGKANNLINSWTSVERDALQTYTGGSYSTINGILRKAGGDLKIARQQAASYHGHYIDVIENMDSYFTRARLTEDVKVIRNTSVSSGPWTNPKIGDILIDDGFISTSVNPNWSGFQSGGCARSSLQIIGVVRQGTPAAWVMPISVVKHEEELLINRGTKFVVTDVVEKRPPSNGCLGDYIIYGEYLP